MPHPILTRIALSGALLSTLASPTLAQTLTAADPEGIEEYRQWRAELAQPVAGEPAIPRQGGAGQRLLLPLYEVDRSRPGGRSTLLGIRNGRSQSTTIEIAYYDRAGTVVRNDVRSLGPSQVATINLRDVAALVAEGDGIARGFAMVTTDGMVSADSLQVDPAQNFATGERLVAVGEGPWCQVWDLRYLNGVAFSGGTTLTVLLGDPLDTQVRSDGAGAVFEVFDEAGASWGVVYYFSNLAVGRVEVADILAALPAAPDNGALEVTFMPGTGGGLVLADYTAEGRYAVSLPGSCMVE